MRHSRCGGVWLCVLYVGVVFWCVRRWRCGGVWLCVLCMSVSFSCVGVRLGVGGVVFVQRIGGYDRDNVCVVLCSCNIVGVSMGCIDV